MAILKTSKLKSNLNKISLGPTIHTENFNLIIKQNHPATVIGKALRQNFQIQQGPGPGQYNTETPLRPKSSYAVFSTYRQPQIKEENKRLGPGSYQPNYEKILRKNSLSCKFNKSPKNINQAKDISIKKPSPTTYHPNINAIKNHQPATKFGRSCRAYQTTNKAAIPGPGQYETQNINTYRSESAFRFTRQKREQSQLRPNEQMPGPFDYTIQGQFTTNIRRRKGFKISLGKNQGFSMINLPGPATYSSDVKLNWRTSPAFSMSHTERKSSIIPKNNNPGPQSYNPEKKLKFQFGSALITASRRQLEKQIEKKKNIPGPGFYEKAFQYKTIGGEGGIKFTIPKNKIHQERISQKRPGPCSYNPIQALKLSIKYGTFGKSQRQAFAKKQQFSPLDCNVSDKQLKQIKESNKQRLAQQNFATENTKTVSISKIQTIPSVNANPVLQQKSKAK